jgi:Zn-dependent protease
MDPGKMRNPRWDHFAAVAAGPLSNLIQAVLYAVAIRIMVLTGSSDGHLLARYALFLQDPGTYPPLPGIELFLLFGVLINLGLCFFNLIPLGPLDGHWLLGTFLAEPARLKWYLWNRQVGGFVFIAVFFLGQMNSDLNVFGRILWPATFTTYQFLVGR